MYRSDKSKKTFLQDDKNPSFSSTLLDHIYRSIDDGAAERFYTEATAMAGKKQSRTQKTRHARRGAFFSSSESSSGGLSSSCSDTESMYGAAAGRSSCRPGPVRTSLPLPASSKPDSNKTRRYGAQMLDPAAYSHNNNSDAAGNSISSNEQGLIKSKSRALKIYNNLKKVKQPISPKLTNFLNSLFTTGNKINAAKQGAQSSSSTATACSSASSFARSCLSKNTPSTTEKRRVRFYPVTVIVDEESRPCGHKYVYEEAEEEKIRAMAVSVPTAWKIGRPAPNKNKSEELQEFKFFKEYNKSVHIEDDDDDDDDVASYSSSDLFELDHLAENNRYCEDLPVYETTHYRAIANGLML